MQAANNLESFLRLPDSTVWPSAAKAMRQLQSHRTHNDVKHNGRTKHQSCKRSKCIDVKSNLTKCEKERLEQLRASMLKKKRERLRDKSTTSLQKSIEVYRTINHQVQHVLRTKKPRIFQNKMMISSLMEQLITINRTEFKAATTIQKICRRWLSINFMQRRGEINRLAMLLQTYMRGRLVRRLFEQLTTRMTQMIIPCHNSTVLFEGYRLLAETKFMRHCDRNRLAEAHGTESAAQDDNFQCSDVYSIQVSNETCTYSLYCCCGKA